MTQIILKFDIEHKELLSAITNDNKIDFNTVYFEDTTKDTKETIYELYNEIIKLLETRG